MNKTEANSVFKIRLGNRQNRSFGPGIFIFLFFRPKFALKSFSTNKIFFMFADKNVFPESNEVLSLRSCFIVNLI